MTFLDIFRYAMIAYMILYLLDCFDKYRVSKNKTRPPKRPEAFSHIVYPQEKKPALPKNWSEHAWPLKQVAILIEGESDRILSDIDVVLKELALRLTQDKKSLDKAKVPAIKPGIEWSLIYYDNSDGDTFFEGPFGKELRSGVFTEMFDNYVDKNGRSHLAILLQGTRHSDVSVMAKELEVIADRLSEGKNEDAEHDDDYGWAFRFTPKTP